MANEITVLERTGRRTLRALFLYPIPTPKQVGGQNVVPTPSAGLPDIAQAVLAQAEKDALDAGTAAWDAVTFHPAANQTNQERLAALRRIYASRQADFDADYQRRYQFAGLRFDAV